jgi:hypothetical protein
MKNDAIPEHPPQSVCLWERESIINGGVGNTSQVEEGKTVALMLLLLSFSL